MARLLPSRLSATRLVPTTAMLVLLVSAIPMMTRPLVMRSGGLLVPMLWAYVRGLLMMMRDIAVMALVMMPISVLIVMWVVVLVVVLVVMRIVVLVLTFNVMAEGRREPEVETRMPISAEGNAHQAKSNHDRGSADEERVAHGILRRRRSIPAALFHWPITASSTPR